MKTHFNATSLELGGAGIYICVCVRVFLHVVACVRTYDKPRSNEHRCQRSPGQRVKRMGSHDNESVSLHSAAAGSCELPRTPPTCSHVPNLTRTAHTSLSAFEACGEVGSVIRRSASVSPSPAPTPVHAPPSLARPAAVGVGYHSNSLFL